MEKARDNPKNTVPEPFRSALGFVSSAAILGAAKKAPASLWSGSQATVERSLGPTPTAVRLRDALWRLIHEAMQGKRKGVQLSDMIVEAGCSYAHAYDLVTGRPEFVVWLLAPSVEIQARCTDLMPYLLARIEDLLTMELFDVDGRVITKNANLFLKVWGFVADGHPEKNASSKL